MAATYNVRLQVIFPTIFDKATQKKRRIRVVVRSMDIDDGVFQYSVFVKGARHYVSRLAEHNPNAKGYAGTLFYGSTATTAMGKTRKTRHMEPCDQQTFNEWLVKVLGARGAHNAIGKLYSDPKSTQTEE